MYASLNTRTPPNHWPPGRCIEGSPLCQKCNGIHNDIPSRVCGERRASRKVHPPKALLRWKDGARERKKKQHTRKRHSTSTLFTVKWQNLKSTQIWDHCIVFEMDQLLVYKYVLFFGPQRQIQILVHGWSTWLTEFKSVTSTKHDKSTTTKMNVYNWNQQLLVRLMIFWRYIRIERRTDTECVWMQTIETILFKSFMCILYIAVFAGVWCDNAKAQKWSGNEAVGNHWIIEYGRVVGTSA